MSHGQAAPEGKTMIPEHEATAAAVGYARPEVRDHGSLSDLTADFDVQFVASAAKMATMAMASAPMAGGGDPAPAQTEAGPGPQVFSGDSLGGGESLPEIGGHDAGGGGGGDRRDGGGAGFLGGGGEDPPVAGAGAAGTLPDGGGGGELPFTGYRASAVASLGATLTVAGMTLRRKLSRRPE